MQKKIKAKNIVIERPIYNIIMFALVFALIIAFVFTLDKLFISAPQNNCGYVYMNAPVTQTDTNCNYDNNEFSTCSQNQGDIIYKPNCKFDCNYCNKEYNAAYTKYQDKTNIERIILTFLMALIFAFVTIKDRIIKYALLCGSLVSLFVATFSAMSMIGSIFPIVIILEFILVIFIYKKTNTNKV
ncbi:MAG: hypothetical protein WCF78_04040 [archaeon]